MSKYTNEELFERYRGLPKDVQDAILSVDTAEIIREIGEKYKLMIDKIGELADETGLVMLGFTHPSQYVSHLAERLEMDKAIAKEIAEEINSKVFFPIRENLKKIHGVEPEEPAPTPGFGPQARPFTPETVVLESTIPKPETAPIEIQPWPAPAVTPEPGPPIAQPAAAVETVEKPEVPATPSAPQKIDPYREQI